MKTHRILISVLLICLSTTVGSWALFNFTPWTFLLQLSLGIVLGLAGFVLLLATLISNIKFHSKSQPTLNVPDKE
jgi:hypothetical protein